MQNAIEFSPVEGAIKIQLRADAKTIEINVDDEGAGIPEFAKERIFERFFSLERPDTGRKSTGLGLN